jgi:hypothetical protein
VEPREGNHVDGQLAQVSVELPGEAQTGRDPRHGGRHEVVEVPVGGRGQLERAEADVVERLVVDAVRLVGVLDELVHGESGVVRLHHRVGHLAMKNATPCYVVSIQFNSKYFILINGYDSKPKYLNGS